MPSDAIMPCPFDAVLFDLDGTLLDSRMGEVLLPQYFAKLSARMAHLLPRNVFLAHLMAATDAMMANEGRATNETVFAEAFYPRLGLPRETVEPIFDDFYQRDFPTLRDCTRTIPAAPATVQSAFDAGCQVAIATNPLFPATAIRQRLKWAGVAAFPYRLVTSYEYSRACKPNLRYYQQIIADLGVPPARCLVVGDEAWDMVAGELGCATFLVRSSETKSDAITHHPTYQGTLADVAALLRHALGSPVNA